MYLVKCGYCGVERVLETMLTLPCKHCGEKVNLKRVRIQKVDYYKGAPEFAEDKEEEFDGFWPEGGD